MALEPMQQNLTLAPTPTSVDGETNGVNPQTPKLPAESGGGDDGVKTPRLPRWTRQEILVLIQGKRVAESRVRRGRVAGMTIGSGQPEPKWASVSGYCKRHGVNRGPVQCRKRWSNLAGDYKKIKEWESQIRDETESFWFMRNDLRREKKLPGFFDKEVYDVLDGSGGGGGEGVPMAVRVVPELALALAPAPAVEEKEEVEVEVVFDSGRSAAPDDGLFSDFEAEEGRGSSEKESPAAVAVVAPVPISEKQYEQFPQGCQDQGTTNEKQPSSNPEINSTSQDGRKRKRVTTEDEDSADLQYRLIDILEKNGKMLTAQLEAQNTNLQLDREQKKIHCDGLLGVLNKLADALGRIADKL